MRCHCCNGATKRFGYYQNRNRTVQRFRCMRCAKTFSESQPLDGVRVSTKDAVRVVELLCEGIGIRAASRLSGLDQKTILNILESAGEHCARLLDAKVRNVKVEQVEVDELYSFVLTRPENTPLGDVEHGEFYLYLSLDRESKLIVNHLVAKRNGDSCRLFMQDLKSRIDGRFQLSTDGFSGYTGYRGAVFSTFKHEIDYGTEVKTYGNIIPRTSTTQRVPRRFNPVVCTRVRRTPMIGNPEVEKINTSRVERLNLSARLFNRRFTRLTLGYSKTLENHRSAAALFVAHYNFCRVHSAHKQTPAMAAGLADHAWTIMELLERL